MYKLEVSNIRASKEPDVLYIYGGRSSQGNILGNPFVLKNEDDRDKICDQHEDYFHRHMRNNYNLKQIT